MLPTTLTAALFTRIWTGPSVRAISSTTASICVAVTGVHARTRRRRCRDSRPRSLRPLHACAARGRRSPRRGRLRVASRRAVAWPSPFPAAPVTNAHPSVELAHHDPALVLASTKSHLDSPATPKRGGWGLAYDHARRRPTGRVRLRFDTYGFGRRLGDVASLAPGPSSSGSRPSGSPKRVTTRSSRARWPPTPPTVGSAWGPR